MRGEKQIRKNSSVKSAQFVESVLFFVGEASPVCLILLFQICPMFLCEKGLPLPRADPPDVEGSRITDSADLLPAPAWSPLSESDPAPSIDRGFPLSSSLVPAGHADSDRRTVACGTRRLSDSLGSGDCAR